MSEQGSLAGRQPVPDDSRADHDDGHDGHDDTVLRQAGAALAACPDGIAMRDLIQAKVDQNARWRGRQCLNLVAAEAPTSPAVRAMLAAEVGMRASGGAIGRTRRWFSAMSVVDDLEALAVELLKQLFHSAFADHRPLGGMHACLAVYTALTRPGDCVMTLPLRCGGDSSHHAEGPPGVRGLRVVDLPFDVRRQAVDLDRFADLGRVHRPVLVGIGQTAALFPVPVDQIRAIAAGWGGRVYVDAAHQAGLIAGGAMADPLAGGADVITGSTGKTFCGPQGGFVAWNDPALTAMLSHAIFPMTTGSHQINRVAALAVAATELVEYGSTLMRRMVANARLLAAALHARGVPVLFAELGYTATHQVMADARHYGGGLATATRLARANIVVNQQPLPLGSVQEERSPGGIRLGTAEVTRLGMGAAEMDRIAQLLADALAGAEPSAVAGDVAELRQAFQTVRYCHDTGMP